MDSRCVFGGCITRHLCLCLVRTGRQRLNCRCCLRRESHFHFFLWSLLSLHRSFSRVLYSHFLVSNIARLRALADVGAQYKRGYRIGLPISERSLIAPSAFGISSLMTYVFLYMLALLFKSRYIREKSLPSSHSPQEPFLRPVGKALAYCTYYFSQYIRRLESPRLYRRERRERHFG